MRKRFTKSTKLITIILILFFISFVFFSSFLNPPNSSKTQRWYWNLKLKTITGTIYFTQPIYVSRQEEQKWDNSMKVKYTSYRNLQICSQTHNEKVQYFTFVPASFYFSLHFVDLKTNEEVTVRSDLVWHAYDKININKPWEYRIYFPIPKHFPFNIKYGENPTRKAFLSFLNQDGWQHQTHFLFFYAYQVWITFGLPESWSISIDIPFDWLPLSVKKNNNFLHLDPFDNPYISFSKLKWPKKWFVPFFSRSSWNFIKDF